MKIWHKIVLPAALAVAFLLGFGAVAYGVLQRQNAALEELATRRLASVVAATDAQQDLGEAHSGVYRMFTWMGNMSEEKVKASTGELAARIDRAAKALGKFRELGNLDAGELKLLEEVQPLVAKYRKLVLDAIDLSTIDVGMGAMAMQAADMHYRNLTARLEDFVELEKKLAQEAYASAAAASRTSAILLVALLAIAAVAALAIAVLMSRAIVRPLHAAIQVASRIAEGDLSREVRVTGADETADLLRALEGMSNKLRDLLRQVSGGAQVVANSSAQIAQGNQDLSQRTEEQASTLEETASSMEELTSTVSLNAQNARDASHLAAGASDIARKGGVAVEQVVSTMNGISESSRRIADIIGVIDGIAFQTNILALNAAVEAARAGEQGRGFAVVAAEVRSLAQRSAEAAKEIKALIGESVEKVDAGTRLVDSAGATMAEIVGAVKKVSDLITEIAAASQEQDGGIRQINTAVTQMEQVVQQNASLVEEAAAATESMKEQAASLLQVVSRFKLGDAEATEAEEPPPIAMRPALARSSVPGIPLGIRESFAGTQVATAGMPVAMEGWRQF